MKKQNIKSASLDEIRKMRDSGELSSSSSEAVAPELPEGFWDEAEVVDYSRKVPISLRVDRDVLNFFKAQGKGNLTRMNAVLRSYMEAKKAG